MTTGSWTSTDLSLWESTFQRLRERFRDAEQRKLRVAVLLVEGGDAGDLPHGFGVSRPWLFGPAAFEVYGDPQHWFYQAAGTEPDALELADIADEAGRALANSPPWVLRDIGTESRRLLANLNLPPWGLSETAVYLPRIDAHKCVFAVFALAWHGYRGTPLQATPRKVWFENAEATLEGFDNLREYPERAPWKSLAGLVANNPDPPTRWYSTLDDLAAASVLACDIILTLGRAEQPTPPAGAATPPAANLGRKFYGLASWPPYPFGDRPQRLPPPETFGTFSADAAKLWAPSQAGTIEGTPTPGNRVCLDWDGVAVELYFPTEGDRVTLAAALPGCDLDNPPWHTVQARLVAAGTSADWPNLTAQAVVALLAKTSTPPPRTGQGEGTGADSQGDKPPAPGGAKATKAKQDKPRTKRERLREQRLKFCRPRRAKGEPWESIYRAYRPKYPKDTKASPDNLRLTFERWEGKYTE